MSYTTGSDSSPRSVAIADFNGDDRLDIAVINYQSNNTIILLGNSNGIFEIQRSLSTSSSGSNSVVIGDFNSDGRKDIAIINNWSGFISIFLGNGNGTFQDEIKVSTGSKRLPSPIVTGDYNNDGHLDLAVGILGYVGILFGNNDGTFQAQTIYSPNLSYVSSLAVGDFNEDDRLDLAVTLLGGDSVFVLFNNGNEGFNTSLILSTEKYSQPQSVAVTDLNNDNRSDLAVANSKVSNIGITLGNGNGSFRARMTFTTGNFSYPNSIVIGDFNNDGQLDLAVTNFYSHNVGIFLGTGDGTFLSQTTFSVGAGSIPNSIVSGDFNNDGKLDLVISDEGLNSVGILLNTCDCCVS